ncbi:MAG TPA: hypothetical protein VEJ36_06585 [Nitrososphaerales archaeon]|nr:hypothetical protein [Nitrososphaerales archaeon]
MPNSNRARSSLAKGTKASVSPIGRAIARNLFLLVTAAKTASIPQATCSNRDEALSRTE